MRIGTSYRALWAISLPVILAEVSEAVIEVVDTVFLAHYGMVELAAIGLADAIYAVAMFATLGLVDGIQIVIARREGQGRPREVGKTFNQGFYLLTVTSITIIAILWFASSLVTEGIIRSAEVGKAVDDFLGIFVFSMLFHGPNLALSAFYTGISRTRVLVGATVILAAVNIVLDYGLIFGNLGLPEMGMRGAAIASLAAEIAAFLYLVLHAIARGHARRYGLFRFGRWNRSMARLLTRISYPVALDSLAETGRWFAFFLIIEQLGEMALAGASVVHLCYMLLTIPVGGFAEAVVSLVSKLVGRGEYVEIGHLIRRALAVSYVVTVPILAGIVLAPEAVLALFTPDRELIAASADSMRVIALAVAVMIPGEIVGSALAGTGDTPATLVIEMILTSTVLAYTFVTALSLAQPLAVVWTGEILGWILCLTLSWAWLRSGRWKRVVV